MNHVKSISITQFRNYLFQQFQFTERIIAISGLNGTGKTNLLDAIYYLCFTKSYFSKPDIQSVFQNLQGFRIDGTIESKNEKEVEETFQAGANLYVPKPNSFSNFILLLKKIFSLNWTGELLRPLRKTFLLSENHLPKSDRH